MEKNFLYKIVKINSDNYRVRIYDRDSHDEFENGSGRWLRDEDTMPAVVGSHISSIVECSSISLAFNHIDKWLSLKTYSTMIPEYDTKKLPPKPAILEEKYMVVLYATKD